MARYTYDGPVQHISIATGRTKGPEGEMISTFEDVALIPDASNPVELPADNPVVLGLIDAGQLELVDDAKTEPAPKTTKKGSR